MELDANYKQFQKASEFRAACALRLEAQRALYEEGRATIDRYLDVVSQYAAAVGHEAQCKASYNISIIAIEEAKGTLLEYDKITVIDSPKSATAAFAGRGGGANAVSTAPATADPFVRSTGLDTAVSPAKSTEKDESPETDLGGKTYSFEFTVGRGARPVEIRGSFTITPARSAGPPKAR